MVDADLDTDDWIICLGAARAVIDGAVACPRQHGRPTPVDRCLDCHLLTWRHDERDSPPPCGTAPEESVLHLEVRLQR